VEFLAGEVGQGCTIFLCTMIQYEKGMLMRLHAYIPTSCTPSWCPIINHLWELTESAKLARIFELIPSAPTCYGCKPDPILLQSGVAWSKGTSLDSPISNSMWFTFWGQLPIPKNHIYVPGRVTHGINRCWAILGEVPILAVPHLLYYSGPCVFIIPSSPSPSLSNPIQSRPIQGISS